jgi:hypothetical protein
VRGVISRASAVATRRRPGCRPPFPAINRRATFGSRYAAGAKEENRNHGLQECGGCPGVRHDGSGLQPFVSFLACFLGRCPRLGWHRAVGPQESACITGFCGWFPGDAPGWDGMRRWRGRRGEFRCSDKLDALPGWDGMRRWRGRRGEFRCSDKLDALTTRADQFVSSWEMQGLRRCETCRTLSESPRPGIIQGGAGVTRTP